MKEIIFTTLFFGANLTLANSTPPTVANTCVGCHGLVGISTNPLWPNLAGQKNDYLSKQLLAFKNGERKDPMMSPIAQSLSIEEIQQLSAYFSELKSQ